MSATVPRARKQSPIQKGKHTSLGKTPLQIMKNIYGADPAPWQHAPGAGDSRAFQPRLHPPELLFACTGTAVKAPRSSIFFTSSPWLPLLFFSVLWLRRKETLEPPAAAPAQPWQVPFHRTFVSSQIPQLPLSFTWTSTRMKLGAHPSNRLPAFSLQLSAWLLPIRKKENGVPMQIFNQRSKEPASGWRS